ncbi:alpha-glucosidase/alpha-galactosidase, partial [Salmonella enterica subsp. enterica serovar Newport]
MMTAPKITFIGAGSTIFVKNILGDVFHREALKSAHVALMDIDETRLEES